jgi:hypothetical protein
MREMTLIGARPANSLPKPLTHRISASFQMKCIGMFAGHQHSEFLVPPLSKYLAQPPLFNKKPVQSPEPLSD